MNVKIMLNKDEEIRRLAADPDVEIRIKDAIIDGVGKRAAKAIDTETRLSIERVCRLHMDELLRKEGFTNYRTKVPKRVTDNIQKTVKEIVKNEIESCVRRIINETATAHIETAIAGKLKELKNIDVAKVIKDAANTVIRKKLEA